MGPSRKRPRIDRDLPRFRLASLPRELWLDVLEKVVPEAATKLLQVNHQLRRYILANGPFGKRVLSLTIDGGPCEQILIEKRVGSPQVQLDLLKQWRITAMIESCMDFEIALEEKREDLEEAMGKIVKRLRYAAAADLERYVIDDAGLQGAFANFRIDRAARLIFSLSNGEDRNGPFSRFFLSSLRSCEWLLLDSRTRIVNIYELLSETEARMVFYHRDEEDGDLVSLVKRILKDGIPNRHPDAFIGVSFIEDEMMDQVVDMLKMVPGLVEYPEEKYHHLESLFSAIRLEFCWTEEDEEEEEDDSFESDALILRGNVDSERDCLYIIAYEYLFCAKYISVHHP